eukprot:3965953-Prymnesium_polylepis.1
MPNNRVAEVSRLLHRTQHQAQQRIWESGMVKRARNPDVTTSNADFQVQHTAKTKQAWRYQGHQIQRAPGLLINAKKYEDPKDPGQPGRKQESNFFITINTNKSPLNAEMEMAVSHMREMLRVLADERTLSTYIKFGPVSPEYREDRFADVIHNIDWKANVETGDVVRRLHAHIWLTITHYSQVQLNVQMLQHAASQAFNRGLPLGSQLRIDMKPYVHVKLLPQSDWTTIMKQYIHKGMGGPPDA